MTRRPLPLRLRLTLAHVAAMLLVLGLYAAAVYVVVERNASQVLDDRLRGDFRWAAEMWEKRPDGTFTWFEGELGDPDAPWLQVWAPDGSLLHRTTNAEWSPIGGAERLASAATGRIVAAPGQDGTYRVLTAPSRLGTQPVVIQVARSEAPMRQDQRNLALILMLGLPLATMAAGVGGYWLARGALGPIDRMAARARSISARDLHDRLPVEHPDDELGRLATVINDMLGRLESSFGQMRRFTSDVSHELRTPLMAMRTVGEVGLREPRTAEGYREVAASMLEEVDRLALLVDRLLALSRAESGAAAPALEAVELGEVAAGVTTQLDVLAEEKGQALVLDRAVVARGIADPVLLRQALTNLVDNAIKYSPHGARVQVTVWSADEWCGLDILDEGPGIAPERRARVFDRFYRDSTAGDGAGLGLGIARWAVDAMGGQLTLETPEARGSLFRIRLRAAESARPVPA